MPRADAASRPQAMTDGDPGTTWVAPGSQPTIALTWDEPTRVDSLDLVTGQHAPAQRAGRGDRQAGAPDGDRGRGRRRTRPAARLADAEAEDPRRVGGSGHERRRRVRAACSPAGVSELPGQRRRASTSPAQVRVVPLRLGTAPAHRRHRWYPTSVDASAPTLLRGASVPLTVCGDAVHATRGGRHRGAGSPSRLFRVDGLDLSLAGSDTSPVGGIRGAPGPGRRRRHPPRSGSRRASRRRPWCWPQNFNDGWQAELEGEALEPQRVDGWQQGWRLPEGAGGTVHLTRTHRRRPTPPLSWSARPAYSWCCWLRCCPLAGGAARRRCPHWCRERAGC